MTNQPIDAPAKFVPLSAIAFADDDQNGQAVSAGRPLPVSTVNEMDFAERLVREGEPIAIYANGTVAVAAGPVNSVIAAVTIGMPSTVGKALWVESITVGLGSRCIGQIHASGDANARFNVFVNQFISRDGGNVTIPVRRLFRGFAVGGNYSISLNVRRLLEADGTLSTIGRDVTGAAGVNGYALTDDLNFDAEKTILVLGDSILNGTGPTSSAGLWTFQARDHFKSQGPTVRIVQMTNSGSTSSEHEAWRKAGRYDGVEADLVIHAVSVNDAGNAVPAATYRANLAAMWAHVQKRWPDATLIIAGPSPLENNTSHANAELLRAEAADFVADTADPKLKYINLGTAFDRLDAGFYVGSDAAGSRVHPDQDGHDAIAAAFNAAVDAQGISLG